MHSPLMIDIAGLELTAEDVEVIKHPKVGGLILFTRNYQDKNQLAALTNSIRSIKPKILIGVDHEGGRVQRFRDGFTLLPPAREFGRLYDKNPSNAEAELRRYVTTAISELYAVGIDCSFAPVLDVDYGSSSVIGDRSFHSDPAIVARLGAVYIDAVHAVKGFAIGKHFPGHGAAINDTHTAIATDERAYAGIEKNDLLPYKIAIKHNIDGVMASHVIYQQVDPMPATFSSYWLKNILREKLNFQGIIFSDDLTMQAASFAGDISARVQLALEAGCDMVLICNNRNGVLKIIKN